MRKTVQDIIGEIRSRGDVSFLEDSDLLSYINDVDDQMSESIFPCFQSTEITLSAGVTSYDLTTYTDGGRIQSVYISGDKIIAKKAPNDILDGWYLNGNNIVLSNDLVTDNAKMVVVYRVKRIPHETETANTDVNLSIPEAYDNLYVLYALSQVAAKEADAASYSNYKTDYNQLLSEMITFVTKNQLSPKLGV